MDQIARLGRSRTPACPDASRSIDTLCRRPWVPVDAVHAATRLLCAVCDFLMGEEATIRSMMGGNRPQLLC